jgi:hypothetical protein
VLKHRHKTNWHRKIERLPFFVVHRCKPYQAAIAIKQSTAAAALANSGCGLNHGVFA